MVPLRVALNIRGAPQWTSDSTAERGEPVSSRAGSPMATMKGTTSPWLRSLYPSMRAYPLAPVSRADRGSLWGPVAREQGRRLAVGSQEGQRRTTRPRCRRALQFARSRALDRRRAEDQFDRGPALGSKSVEAEPTRLLGRSPHSAGFDLVPCEFERPHDCFRLSDRKESINVLSSLAGVLRQGASDHSSNLCLLSPNGHDASHNVSHRRTSYHVPSRALTIAALSGFS